MADEQALGYIGIDSASTALTEGSLTALDLTEAALARIDRLNPTLNAYVRVMAESARADARAADARAAAGKRLGPLDGIPIAIKDVIDTAGVVTTYGSINFRDHRPDADAHVVRQLRNAGAVILGKTNTHELARGITTDNPHFGPTRNPWDLTRHPGGSSGGSGAAIAMGMALGALGTDTGGSVRIPAHMTGISGLKPTFGLVGRSGARPLVRNFDHIGPMTRSAADCALMLEAMAGPDPNDPDAVTRPTGGFATALEHGIGGYRAGIVQDFADDALPRIRELFDDAVQVLRDLSVEIDSWSLPATLEPKAAQVVSRSEGYVSIYEMFDGDFSSIAEPIRDPPERWRQRLRFRLSARSGGEGRHRRCGLGRPGVARLSAKPGLSVPGRTNQAVRCPRQRHHARLAVQRGAPSRAGRSDGPLRRPAGRSADRRPHARRRHRPPNRPRLSAGNRAPQAAAGLPGPVSRSLTASSRGQNGLS